MMSTFGGFFGQKKNKAALMVGLVLQMSVCYLLMGRRRAASTFRPLFHGDINGQWALKGLPHGAWHRRLLQRRPWLPSCVSLMGVLAPSACPLQHGQPRTSPLFPCQARQRGEISTDLFPIVVLVDRTQNGVKGISRFFGKINHATGVAGATGGRFAARAKARVPGRSIAVRKTEWTWCN